MYPFHSVFHSHQQTRHRLVLRRVPGFSLPRGSCVKLYSMSPEVQQSAVNLLVRPGEMADKVAYDLMPLGYRFATGVAHLVGHQFQYISDPHPGRLPDYWCSPARTRYRGGGDCDDLSILTVSWLLNDHCTNAWLVTGLVLTEEGWGGHAWVEGLDQWGRFHIEATSGAFHHGRRPLGYLARLLLFPGRGYVEVPLPRWQPAARSFTPSFLS